MSTLPKIECAGAAWSGINAIQQQSGSLFQALFVEERAVGTNDIEADISSLVEANLCRLVDGRLTSNFRVSKVYELFIVTDFPSYLGSDRVWYLLEDESLLFARHIPDCTGKHTLDIGSGSGVLALMCARNGADSSVSIDISPRATHLSRFNAALNRLDRVEFQTAGIGDFKPARKFDYITFNPPFVPLPDETRYMLSGSGGRDGLALVHTFFARLAELTHAATGISLISMSPGDEQIALLERLFIKRYYGRSVSIISTDVYGETAPIEMAFKPFAREPSFAEWQRWLNAQGYTRLHYLFINLFPAARYEFRRVQLRPPLEDLPDSGTWGAMYRVIQNSKDHA